MNVPDERGLKLSPNMRIRISSSPLLGEMNVPDERGLKLIDRASADSGQYSGEMNVPDERGLKLLSPRSLCASKRGEMNVPDERGLKLLLLSDRGVEVALNFGGEMNVPDERGLKQALPASAPHQRGSSAR